MTTICTCQYLDHKAVDCLYPAGCTGCVCPRHTATLVAHDFGGNSACQIPNITEVLEAIGEALVRHWSRPEPCGSDHALRRTHRILFDTRLLRGSEAHGIGYRHGFIVAIDHERQS